MQEQTVSTVPISDVEPEQKDKKRKASDYSDYKFDLGFSTLEEIDQDRRVGRNEAETHHTIMPTIPVSEAVPSNTEELLYTLRHFHLGDPSTIEKTEAVGDDYVPALLHAYRDASKVRYDYPLFLYPTGNTEANAEQLAKPISLMLQEWVESFAPSTEAARILKDNLPRIEKELRNQLKCKEAAIPALPLLSKIGPALQKDLGLNKENHARFQADFDKLLELIPTGGEILGYGHYAAIHLLSHAIHSRLIHRRTHFREKIEQLIRDLKTLLDIDWRKSDESVEPQKALNSVGTASSRFDPIFLSDMMAHSQSSLTMPAPRRERVLNALQILEAHLQNDDPILVRFVHLEELTSAHLENRPNLEVFSDLDPCTKATELFDQEVSKWANFFSAARIAQLEINGIYDPAIHDPWFANFTWEAFSKEEILLLPAVVALESGERAAGEGMTALSHLLSSGRPVQILVKDRTHSNSHSLSDDELFLNYRLELGYFGISHRQAIVSQSSSARHQHLLTQFLSALDATRTSLHIINIGLQHFVHGINPWLVAGAALESRAHPFFYINPDAGDASADRMDFTGNPQQEVDWSHQPFQYQNEKGEVITTDLAFTFADYALLVPSTHKYFRQVPVGVESEHLIPIEAYLSNCQKNDCQLIPFIWAANGKGELRKLVVSRPLVFACQDRLNYWHTLQELAGIRNKYVDMAVQKAREEVQVEELAKRERLQTEHTDELEQVRKETASEVMQRLTDVLLGLDLTTTSQPVTRKPVTPSVSPATEVLAETEPEAEKEVEEEVVFDDPWIDSDLCTSCNDCLNINTVLFVYNESKQAVLGEIGRASCRERV